MVCYQPLFFQHLLEEKTKVLGGGALTKGDSKHNLARLSLARHKHAPAPVYVGCNPCSMPRLRGSGFETLVLRARLRARLQLLVLGLS